MVFYHENLHTFSAIEAARLWRKYIVASIPVLGSAGIGNPEYALEQDFWLGRIKGMALANIQVLHFLFNDVQMRTFYEGVYGKNECDRQYILLAETTIEVGLASLADLVLYNGKNLVVYKGVDTVDTQGELMIAVKHKSGCWGHYPSPDNLKVNLSEYKCAKQRLADFPVSLKGEIVHPASVKLSKLLGLVVKNNYAYLVK